MYWEGSRTFTSLPGLKEHGMQEKNEPHVEGELHRKAERLDRPRSPVLIPSPLPAQPRSGVPAPPCLVDGPGPCALGPLLQYSFAVASEMGNSSLTESYSFLDIHTTFPAGACFFQSADPHVGCIRPATTSPTFPRQDERTQAHAQTWLPRKDTRSSQLCLGAVTKKASAVAVRNHVHQLRKRGCEYLLCELP